MDTSTNKTAFFIALRYLFSRKKHNIINVISAVSVLGILVSSAALIVVLSVFNGMQNLIGSWFNTFNPDFEVTLAEGKSFAVDSFPSAEVAALPEVAAVHEVVSDLVLTTYNEKQELLRLKGVTPEHIGSNHFDELLIDGSFDLYRGEQPCAVLGTGAAGKLLIQLNQYDLLKLYYPKRTKKNLANPADAFRTLHLYPAGVFCTNTAYDLEMVFCPIDFARDLMGYPGEVTSMEIQLKKSGEYGKVQEKIQRILGPKYKLQNKYQQEESLFRTMQSEKLVIYVILAFILLVAAFNIIGSLGMLILEKQRDTSVLRSLGASQKLVRRIFLFEGMGTSLAGGLGGLFIGAIICLLQQWFHIVKLGGDGTNYIIQYYPVQMRAIDFFIVLLTVLSISLLTSIIPARKLQKILQTTP